MMPNRFSAYLSIYNDWDILTPALRSVAEHVDELVVVDGAYEWMVPYVSALGLDPTRSDPRVYAAIEEAGIPFRVIARVWNNEPEKRLAGYAACANRYVYRVDADEVQFFNDDELANWLSQKAAVGEMEMPAYLAPGWVVTGRNETNIGRQCFLFDRAQVTPEIHLNYLWLVLTSDQLPLAGNRPFKIHPDPLAFNAHLSGWRRPETAANRAAFYILNWMREFGVPWLPELRGRPLADAHELFRIVPATAFLWSMRRGRIAVGLGDLRDDRTIRPSTLAPEREATILGIYRDFLDSLATMNAAAASEPQSFVTGMPTLLDISTPAAREALAPDGIMTLRLSAKLYSAKVQAYTCATTEPHTEISPLHFELDGTDLRITLPAPRQDVLRQSVEFLAWLDSPLYAQSFQALR